MADVITPLVFTKIEELSAVTAQNRPVVTLQAPIEPSYDLPSQAAQRTLGCKQWCRVHVQLGGLAAHGAEHHIGERDSAQDRTDNLLRGHVIGERFI